MYTHRASRYDALLSERSHNVYTFMRFFMRSWSRAQETAVSAEISDRIYADKIAPSIVCIPLSCFCSIKAVTSEILPAATRSRISLSDSIISYTAILPFVPFLGSSFLVTTPFKISASRFCISSLRSWGKLQISRCSASSVRQVYKDEITRCPASAVRIASMIVSVSGSSPI